MNRADRNRTRRWERAQARKHAERERAASEMAAMSRAFDKGRAGADAIVWDALEMMMGKKRSRHNAPCHGAELARLP
jgi:hypothetical protein